MKRKLLSIIALLCLTVGGAWAESVNCQRSDIGKLMGDDGIAYTLQPATEDQEKLIWKYSLEWDLGGDGEGDEWNWGHPGEDR